MITKRESFDVIIVIVFFFFIILSFLKNNDKMKNIKIGLFGAGYFGNFHLNNLLKTPFEVIGFFDADKKRAEEIEKTYNVKSYSDPTKLMLDCDAIDITTPTSSHFQLIKKALSLGKHVFVEKPMTFDTKQAKEIIEIISNTSLKLQVGHIERFNPVITDLEFKNEKIVHIEANRLSTYNPRGTDVSVVFDLMIHDLDLVLYLAKDEAESIVASGLKKYGNNLEFTSANIRFKNGITASLNASIIHPYMERKLKIWTDKRFIELDLAEKTLNFFEYLDLPEKDNNIIKNSSSVKKDSNNSILDELNEFYISIAENTKTKVSEKDGFYAVKLAEDILKSIQSEMI